jgi:uncharacterized protein YbjT (DUF2867 family)
MDQKKALIIGSSGLIGSHLIQFLLNDPNISNVRSLVRKPSGIMHPKLEEIVIDFNDMHAFEQNMGNGDFIFSCIGTTINKVKGNKQLYRKIDFDIPVNAARFGIKAGYHQFLIVSAHLANAKSNIFYSRLKGETDEIISTFPFSSIHIFRPSFLIGKRNEQRWIEICFGKIMQKFSFLLPSAYRPVSAETLAQAMLNASLSNKTGVHYYHFTDIKNITSRPSYPDNQ